LYEDLPVDINFPPPAIALEQGGPDQALHPLGSSALSPRAGFNAGTNEVLELWAHRLGAGWYLDWTVQPRFAFQMPEHWQMVRLSKDGFFPNAETISWLATHYPGNVWIIGNEPENIWQDNIPPEMYAQYYHDLYLQIKEADPSAKIAVGGVTQPTPLRLAYLDRMLAFYLDRFEEPLPADWWTVHGFVLREERGNWGAEIPVGFPEVDQGNLYTIPDVGSLQIFKDQIIAFRVWMAERGYQDTPLALTEFGILLSEIYGYPPSTVAEYLAQTFLWLDQARDLQVGYPPDDYHLVQRWAWFSLFDRLYYGSNLANVEWDAITDIGWEFRSFVEGRMP
jgi:hypothetical protein